MSDASKSAFPTPSELIDQSFESPVPPVPEMSLEARQRANDALDFERDNPVVTDEFGDFRLVPLDNRDEKEREELAKDSRVLSLFAASRFDDPDRYAGIRALHDETGVDMDVADKHYDKLKKTAIESNLDARKWRKHNPILFKWLEEDHSRAGIVFDDENVSQFRVDLEHGLSVMQMLASAEFNADLDDAEIAEQRALVLRERELYGRKIRRGLSDNPDENVPPEATPFPQEFYENTSKDTGVPIDVYRKRWDEARQREVDLYEAGPLKNEQQLNKAQGWDIFTDVWDRARMGSERSRLGERKMIADLAVLTAVGEERAGAERQAFELDKQIAELDDQIGVAQRYDVSGVGQLAVDATQGIASLADSFEAQGKGLIGGAVIGGAIGAFVPVPGAAKIGARTGAGVGVAALGFSNSYQLESGSLYLDLLKTRDDEGKPIDKKVALAFAMIGGVAKAGIELAELGIELKAMGLGGLLLADAKPGHVLADIMKDKGKKALLLEMSRGIVARYVKHIAGETAEESSQAAVDVLAEFGAIWASGGSKRFDLADAGGKVVEAGGHGGLTAGVAGVVGGSVNLIKGQVSVEIALRQKARIEAITKLMRSKRLAQVARDVDRLVELTTEESGSKVTHLYADPQRLVDTATELGIDADNLATELMGEGGPQRLHDALADRVDANGSRSTLEIPVVEWGKTWGTNDASVELVPHLTARAGSLNASEIPGAVQELREAADGILKAEEAIPASLPLMSEAWGNLPDDTARASERFADPTTGLRNEAGLAATPADPSRGHLAVFDLEAGKLINDKFGHDTLDGGFRSMAQTLTQSGITDGAKVGGSVLAWVRDDAHAAELAASMKADIDPNLRVVYGTAAREGTFEATRDAAFAASGSIKETLRAKKKLGHRKGVPAALSKGLPKEVAFEEGEPGVSPSDPAVTKVVDRAVTALGPTAAKLQGVESVGRSELSPEHLEQFQRESGTAFETTYQTPQGLLNFAGRLQAQKLNPQPFVASADLRAFKDIDQAFGREEADSINDEFERAVASAGGGRFDAWHQSGDEYGGHGASEQQLLDFWSKLRDRAAELVFYLELPDGSVVVQNGLQFAVGVAPTFKEADGTKLPAAKKDQDNAETINKPVTLSAEQVAAGELASLLGETGTQAPINVRELVSRRRAERSRAAVGDQTDARADAQAGAQTQPGRQDPGPQQGLTADPDGSTINAGEARWAESDLAPGVTRDDIESARADPTPESAPRRVDIRKEAGAPVRTDGTLNATESIDSLETPPEAYELEPGDKGGKVKQTREVYDWIEKFRKNKKVREQYTEAEIDSFVNGLIASRAIFGEAIAADLLPEELGGSPLRKNADFKKTFDITTICPKQDAFVNTVYAVEARLGRVLTPHQRYSIGLMMRDLGAQPACWYCYGQAARDAFDSHVGKAIDVTRQAVELLSKGEGRVRSAEWDAIWVNDKEGRNWKVRGRYPTWVRANWKLLEQTELPSAIEGRDLARGIAEATGVPVIDDMANELRAFAQAATNNNAPKAWATLKQQILRMAPGTVEGLNDRAGLRMNSQADFRPWHLIEMAEAVASMKASGLMAHVYTKESDFLEVFGGSGFKFNLSALYESDADGKLVRDADGRPVFDSVIGMAGEDIVKWREAHPADVGGMLVAQNDEALLEGLDDDRIDMIIPYHKGAVAAQVNRDENARDFTPWQHEQEWGERRNRKVEGKKQPITEFKFRGEWVRKGDERLVPVPMPDGTTKLMPVEIGEGLDASHHNSDSDTYFAIVNALGVAPKFSVTRHGTPLLVGGKPLVEKVDGKWVPRHPNYMKLIKDTARDPQNQTVPDPAAINWDAGNAIVKKWIDEGGDQDTANESVVSNVIDRIRRNDWPQYEGSEAPAGSPALRLVKQPDGRYSRLEAEEGAELSEEDQGAAELSEAAASAQEQTDVELEQAEGREGAVSLREDEIRGLEHERGYLIGKDGEELGAVDDGNPKSIMVPDELVEAAIADGNAVFSHNHPSSLPHSEEDVALGVKMNLAEMRAVRNDGAGTYLLARDGSTWIDEGAFVDGLPSHVYSDGKWRSGWSADVVVLVEMRYHREQAFEKARKRMDEHILAAGGVPGSTDAKGYSDAKWDELQREEIEKAVERYAFFRPGFRGTFEHSARSVQQAPESGGSAAAGQVPEPALRDGVTPKTASSPARLYDSPVWHSAALEAVTSAKQAKNTPAAWLAMLKKSPGIRQEELDFLGIEEWLAKQPGKSVAREDVAAFIDANGLVVDEQVLGGGISQEVVEEVSQIIALGIGFWDSYRERRSAVLQGRIDELGDDLASAGEIARLELEQGVIADINHRVTQAERAIANDDVTGAAAEIEKVTEYPIGATYFDAELGEISALQMDTTDTYHEDYTVGGHTPGSYREVILRLPGTEARKFGGTEGHLGSGEGIVAHLRVSTHTTADGKRMLFLEESQSDLHQAGAKKGYERRTSRDGEVVGTPEDVRRRLEDLLDSQIEQLSQPSSSSIDARARAIARLREIRDEVDGSDFADLGKLHMALLIESGRPSLGLAGNITISDMRKVLFNDRRGTNVPTERVPSAPLKTTWPEFTIKRLISMAVAEGFDTIGWTPGEVQEKRYDQGFDQVEVNLEEDGFYSVSVGNGGAFTTVKEGLEQDELADVIGEANAAAVADEEDIDATSWGFDSNEVVADIIGSGMREFYDRKVKGIVQKMVKKGGGKVDTTLITDRHDDNVEVWTATIPERLSNAVKAKGFPVFQPEKEAYAKEAAAVAEHEASKIGLGIPLFPDVDAAVAAGIPAATYELYLDKLDEATKATAQRVASKAAQVRAEEASEAWAAEVESNLEQAKKDWAEQPGLIALSYIRNGKIVDDNGDTVVVESAGRMDRNQFREAVGGKGTELEKRLNRRLVKGGESPAAVAARFGFTNGADMLAAVENVLNSDRKEWTQERAEELTREAHPERADALGRMQAEAQAALHTAANKDWMFRELADLRRLAPDSNIAPVDAIERAAIDRVARMPIGRLGAKAALKRQLGAANQAALEAAKQNYPRAGYFKQRQVYFHFLWRELERAERGRESFKKQAVALSKPASQSRLGKASNAHRDVVNSLNEALELRPRDPLDREPRETLATLGKQMESSGDLPSEDAFDFINGIISSPRPWRSLTVEEMADVNLAMRQISKSATRSNTVLMEGRRHSREETTVGMLAQAAESSLTVDHGALPSSPAAQSLVEAGLELGSVFDAAMLKPHTLLGWLGDKDVASTWHAAILQPLVDAKAERARIMEATVRPIVDAFNKMPANVRSRMRDDVDGKTLFPNHRPDLDPPSKVFEVVMMVFNRGNRSSIERLTDGRGITLKEVDAAIESINMPKETWEWVQTVVDQAESLWPQVKALEERYNGVAPQKLERVPFFIKSSTGPIIMKGGYWPAAYDPRVSQAGLEQQANAKGMVMPTAYRRPSTRRSHTKGRAEGFSDAIALMPSLMQRHFFDVAHDLSHREAIRSVAGLILSDDVKASMVRHLGAKRAAIFPQWLADISRSDSGIDAHIPELESMQRKLKSNHVVGTLGYAVDNFAADAFTFTTAPIITDLTAASMATGLRMFARHPKKVTEFVHSLSPSMASRSEEVRVDFERQVKSMIARGGAPMAAFRWWRDHGFWIPEQIDNATSTVIWMGRYHQAMADGATQEEAILLGDRVVRQSLPSFDALEKAPIFRSKGMLGSLLAYFGYMNVLFNARRDLAQPAIAEGQRLAQDPKDIKWDDIKHLTKTTSKAGARIMALTFVTGVFAELIMGRGPEPSDGDDPAEKWTNWALRKWLVAQVSDIPFVGGPLESWGMGKKPSIRHSPQFGVFDELGRAAWSAWKDGGDGEKAAWLLMKSLSRFLGNPTRPVNWVQHWYELATGQSGVDEAVDRLGGFYGDRTALNPSTAAQELAP